MEASSAKQPSVVEATDENAEATNENAEAILPPLVEMEQEVGEIGITGLSSQTQRDPLKSNEVDTAHNLQMQNTVRLGP
jgi:hypothetical protein